MAGWIHKRKVTAELPARPPTAITRRRSCVWRGPAGAAPNRAVVGALRPSASLAVDAEHHAVGGGDVDGVVVLARLFVKAAHGGSAFAVVHEVAEQVRVVADE